MCVCMCARFGGLQRPFCQCHPSVLAVVPVARDLRSVQKCSPCWPSLSGRIVCLSFSAKVSDVIDIVARVHFRAHGSFPCLGHKQCLGKWFHYTFLCPQMPPVCHSFLYHCCGPSCSLDCPLLSVCTLTLKGRPQTPALK